MLDHGVIVGETQHGHPMGHPVLGQGDPTLETLRTLGILCVSPPWLRPASKGFGVSGGGNVPGGDVMAAPLCDAVRRL